MTALSVLREDLVVLVTSLINGRTSLSVEIMALIAIEKKAISRYSCQHEGLKLMEAFTANG